MRRPTGFKSSHTPFESANIFFCSFTLIVFMPEQPAYITSSTLKHHCQRNMPLSLMLSVPIECFEFLNLPWLSLKFWRVMSNTSKKIYIALVLTSLSTYFFSKKVLQCDFDGVGLTWLGRWGWVTREPWFHLWDISWIAFLIEGGLMHTLRPEDLTWSWKHLYGLKGQKLTLIHMEDNFLHHLINGLK